jgi:phage terminase large subunit
MIYTHADLFTPPPVQSGEAIKPWKPVALSHEQWPPDYAGVYAWRIKTLAELRADPAKLASAKAYYSTRFAEFIMHWMDTYNPRKQSNKWMPFVLFERQSEYIDFLDELRRDNENGLIEKCRDIGATWLSCAYSVCCVLFLPDDSTGWGSRKEELVDKIGDPDSIFEKMAKLIDRLPDVFVPADLKRSFMRIVNPSTGGTITGESGDNIGRGGRKSRYFKDESAHYERPELIEAALADNTDVQIDISSVNGLGNVFHRRREAGVTWSPGIPIEPGLTRVFVFDWRDHPEKTQEWYDRRKAKAEREGMQHIFAQEVDRNYSAAVQNTIISYEWIEACVDAHFHIPCLRVPPSEEWMAGFDVRDEGGDRHALVMRQGIILRKAIDWGGPDDPGQTTRDLIAYMREFGKRCPIQYDCIGVGATVKSEYNRLIQSGELDPELFSMVPWHAGAAVQEPFARVVPGDEESSTNRDFFMNFKAQAWWSLRTRCYKTWRARTFGDQYHPDELMSIDSTIPSGVLLQLKKELAQPTRAKTGSLKLVIEKKPSGTRSPNLADAIVQCYNPVPDRGGSAILGAFG